MSLKLQTQKDRRSPESTKHLLRSGVLQSLDALFLGGKVGDLGGDSSVSSCVSFFMLSRLI